MYIFILTEDDIVEDYIDDINKLLSQLTDKPKRFTRKELKEIIKQENLFVYVAIGNDSIVGMASLKVDNTKMLTQDYTRGFIGDVVVDKSIRGQGMGEILVKHLIDFARLHNLKQVNLTSNPNNPKRATAIKMYERVGFKKIGQIGASNYYRLEL
jgi:ribosomal protein S18 acetylase RimI-like enzyme